MLEYKVCTFPVKLYITDTHSLIFIHLSFFTRLRISENLMYSEFFVIDILSWFLAQILNLRQKGIYIQNLKKKNFFSKFSKWFFLTNIFLLLLVFKIVCREQMEWVFEMASVIQLLLNRVCKMCLHSLLVNGGRLNQIN